MQLRADDGNGLTTEQTVLVTVGRANEFAPLFTSANTAIVDENTTAVQTISATDADLPAQTVTFEISGGADGDRFEIVADDQLVFKAAPDFETKLDSNADNIYEVELTANDGNGLTTQQTVLVSVTPVNDLAPAFTSAATVSVDENTTAVQTIAATDADLPTQVVTFSLSGTGADSTLFQITGGNQLEFITAPDVETPGDSNGDNTYEVELVANDGNGLTTTQTVLITVGPVNDLAPVFTSPDTARVDENTTAVQTIVATDADVPAQVVTFSIGGTGADNALFQITGGNQLEFIAAPDFEIPGDFDGDNVYEVQLVADDGSGLTTQQTVLVTVDPVNDLAPVFSSSASVIVPENTTAIQAVSATDGDLPGQTVTITINGGADAGLFKLVGDQLEFTTPPDYEDPQDFNGDNTYEVQLRADDGNGLTTEQTVLVTVGRANEFAPLFTSANAASVDENTTAVQTISATDADLPAQTVTFEISGGADGDRFEIVADDQLVFKAAPDFETKLDSNADNIYEVELTADDGNGLTTQQTVLVSVTPVNDLAPAFTSAATVIVDENTTAVQTIAATDADLPAQVVTFSLSGTDADNTLFQITGGDQLEFITAPDVETPGDSNVDNTYEVELVANDGNGLTTTQTVLITVGPVNDLAPVFTSPDTARVDENTTAVQTIVATDADVPAQVVTFSIGGTGADNALFQITGGTQLEFIAAPDFEIPGDFDGDNVYEVQLVADDGNGLTTQQAVLVTVDPVNDLAPVFSSSASVIVSENTTAVQVVSATDGDLPAQTVSFSISGGADAGRFQLSGGQLEFTTPPDYEDPQDANDDNVYEVQLRADDGNGLTTEQTVLVTVGRANEFAPVFTSANAASVDENTTAVQTISATDADLPAQTVTFEISGGADGDRFEIVADDQLVFKAAPDFETKLDSNADNIYEVELTADDGNGLTTQQTVLVTVLPVNDLAPVFTSPMTVTVPENTTAVQVVSATDEDLPAQTVTFSISGGADAAQFQLSGDQLAFKTAPDYENPQDANGENIYEVQVHADDGNGLTTQQTVLVTVVNSNAFAPVFDSDDAASVNENTSTVQIISATDADLPAQTVTFSISGGADSTLFQITDGNQLKFIAAPDFETPLDDDGNNVYEVEIEANDNAGLSTTQTVLITVNPVNDFAPVFTSVAAVSIAENTTSIQTISATDADLPAQTVTFSISGSGADDAKFKITAGNQLSFIAAPDFETPLDANNDNVYALELIADDGNGLTTLQTVLVTIDQINEAPFVANAIADVTADEDRSDDLVDLSAVFGDPDAGDSVRLTVVANTNPTLVNASIAGTVLTLDYLNDESGTADVTIRATDSEGLFAENTFTAAVLSASDRVQDIIGDVESLNSSGVLNGNEVHPLISKLNGALSNLLKQNFQAATNQMKAFINQVNAFVKRGTLSAVQGSELIEAAENAIDSIPSRVASAPVAASKRRSDAAVDSVSAPIHDSDETLVATIGVERQIAVNSLNPWDEHYTHEVRRTPNVTADSRIGPIREELVDQIFALEGEVEADAVLHNLDLQFKQWRD